MFIPESELILNSDGSVYHLHLKPEDIAETILFVGDPDRVGEVSKHFDSIEFTKHKREFVTHTGYIGNKRLTVLSTGIGTDNIDIVWNELNMLANIDLPTRTFKHERTKLKVIRIGTSGSLQKDIPVDSILASTHGFGLDVLMHYYPFTQDTETRELEQQFSAELALPFLRPYLVQAPGALINLFSDSIQGITATCSGFYAPQGRIVNTPSSVENLIERLSRLQTPTHRITNFEMETAGIYGLANTFGHEAVSINAIVANRITHEFSADGQEMIDKTIRYVLEKLIAS
ncbi:MAG: nucleoside phosphorylase [Bacteroidota bacterium]